MRFSAARPLWEWEILGANERDCAVGCWCWCWGESLDPWRRPKMEEVCSVRVPGVCLDAYLGSQMPLCSSPGAECVVSVRRLRTMWYPSCQPAGEMCVRLSMFCAIIREVISLVIRRTVYYHRSGKSLSTRWHYVTLEFYNSTTASMGLLSGGSGVLTPMEILHAHPHS